VSSSNSTIPYIDRQTGFQEHEVVLGDSLVKFVYERAFGRLLRRTILTRRLFSQAYGLYQSSKASRSGIEEVIKNLAIDMSQYEVPDHGFSSFNDFFTRKLRPGARPIDSNPQRFVAPADGRTFAYTSVSKDTLIPTKGHQVSLSHLLGGPEAAKPFAFGSVLIVRLCPSDYHRFHFPCSGTAESPQTLAGPLESVNPWALATGLPILDQNLRDLTYIQTKNFGKIAYLEIGAMCVGSIVHSYQPGPVQAGDEKGYFQFGGSTVVIVFPANSIQFDQDLIDNTYRGIETFLRMGEGIGTALSPQTTAP
jgi:phosphatidylserine decarboxylase